MLHWSDLRPQRPGTAAIFGRLLHSTRRMPSSYFKTIVWKKNHYLKVADPKSGWCEIRPYNSQTWKFLRATYKCPFMLLSATMEENSLERVLGMCTCNCLLLFSKPALFQGALEIDREDLAVLYKNPDRPNIFSQRRILKNPVDVMYVSSGPSLKGYNK